jgi:hypothetical protein
MASAPDPADLGDDAPTTPSAGRPVALEVEPEHDEPLRRWIEGVLGWQAVDRTTSRLVPPTVHLVGLEGDPPDDGVARVLILPEDADPRGVVAACTRLRPVTGIVWPRQREDLARVVEQVAAGSVRLRSHRHVVRVGGVAGGVGTTTVVLALAGLVGWQDRRTLAVVRGDTPAADVPVVSPEAVGAADLWSRLRGLPGVPAARAVRVAGPAPAAEPRDPTIEFAVLDHGVDTDTDVVVCRPDAAARERLPGTTAGAVVVMGPGPLRLPELRAAAGGRPITVLPWSSRVARAGFRRRVPTSLPGAWLRCLLPLLPQPHRGGPNPPGEDVPGGNHAPAGAPPDS